MRSRFDGWQRVSGSPRVFFDRSIDEDARVFCRMHRELNLLNSLQFERLQELARELQQRMPAPDLIIFLSPNAHILEQRVTRASHPPLIVSNLNRQVCLYTDWLATRTEDILKLDNSECSLGTIQRFLEEEPRC
jgi:hypothetical protein